MMWRQPQRNVPSGRGTGSDVIVKAVTLFLIAMALLAMFGKLRLPGRNLRRVAKCRDCGRYLTRGDRCTCRR